MAKYSLLAAWHLSVSVSASALYSTYNFNPLHHLTGIAPYFESQDPPASPDVPHGCIAERAAYLVRHAAIYANDFDYDEYIEPFVKKLDNTTNIQWSKIPGLNFLANWQAPISDAEVSILTRVGRLEATQLGVDLNFRYPNFSVPKQIWTSSASRTLQSAKSLARGLEDAENTVQVHSIYESKEAGANSLTPYKGCPAYSSSSGGDESDVYKKIYTKPILARLHDAAPGFNFTDKDVFGMQQLCGYETVIRGKSPFCSLELFSPDDWLAWEYSEDIRYHYNVGYGNAVAGYNGLPWLNATGNLLMSNEKNSSIDDLLVSFTHRELPPMVIVAMGLFNNSEFNGAANINDTMPTNRINYRREWKSSNILPFLGNIAIERLKCSGSYGYQDGDYYRALVNSAPQPLPNCADGPGTSCSRDAFGKYLENQASMFSGFTEHCNATYKNSTDVMTLYSEARNGTMG
ncbi:hypothetical protein NQ176_g7508 [Zarea fungicola]|uniref:Uncharacterized protein n=1 Tax=Zarea fungicola TaxID=93591 RepID=A0ACC1MXT8_9HYPO|nr:hypothetical protein NQ176_g7508 [Lecanicillium fungicola]